MTPLPHLELSDHHRSPFDEAVILIGGREEDTITIECEGALELADQLIRLVNDHSGAFPPPDHQQSPYAAGAGLVGQMGELP
jgi:hypothetical protein